MLIKINRAVVFFSLIFGSLVAQAKPCVIIMHGFMSHDYVHHERVSPLTKLLRERGLFVHVARTSLVASHEEHVWQLDQELDRSLPPECTSLALIGHSQGGLVSRVFAHTSKYADRVFSITTVGTPHRGPIIDGDAKNGMAEGMRARLEGLKEGSAIQLLSSRLLEVGDLMSPAYMENEFNLKYTNIEGIEYVSLGTVTDLVRSALLPFRKGKILFEPSYDFSSLHDGLVSLQSSMWENVLYADGRVRPVHPDLIALGPVFVAGHLSQIVGLPHGSLVNLPANQIAVVIANYLADLIQDKNLNWCESMFHSDWHKRK